MATRYYTFAVGEYYHIYNRGNSKQPIFKDSHDYRRFLELLFLANGTHKFTFREIHRTNRNLFDVDRGTQQIYIGAYALMPNHFHILLTPQTEEGVTTFMLKLESSYAMYFNKKYQRTGSLYESSYRSRYAYSDRYLKYLFSYIHLNPIPKHTRNRLVDFQILLDRCQFTSLPEYFGHKRESGCIISPEHFPVYFRNVREHRKEIFDWLDYND